ncbi:MAG: tripartite tricarboxylate transporter TctB family protein [Polaromonas sp.]|nr:tripartite tricarboxylate transporter TctB family protein [Polaromonas sp.]
MSDRILGTVCVVVAAGMAWSAQSYVAPVSYEPVGPRSFPLLLAGLIGLIGAWLVVRPSESQGQAAFSRANLMRTGICALTVAGYALLFQPLGFVVATALMTVPVGMVFGGTWKRSLLAGVVMGITLFFLFDRVLDVVLPTGLLSAFLGGR